MKTQDIQLLVKQLCKIIKHFDLNVLKVTLLIYLVQSVLAKPLLIAQYFYGDFQDTENWYFRDQNVSSNTYCGASKLFGGYQGFNSSTIINKIFELPPHYQVLFHFSFWRIDNWNNNRFSIYFDKVEIHNQIYSSDDSTTNICGDNLYFDQKYYIEKAVDHRSTTAQILMITNGAWWGISEFSLYAISCQYGCITCNQFGCQRFIVAIELFSKSKFDSISSKDGWTEDDAQITTIKVSCADFNYLYSTKTSFEKTFEIGNHVAVLMRFNFLVFNSNSAKITVVIDGNIILIAQKDKQLFKNFNVCLMNILNSIEIMQLEHTQNTITIQIIVEYSTRIYTNQAQYIGLRDFQLFLKPTENFEFCEDQNLYSKDKCYPEIYKFTDGCSNYIKDVCIYCQDGWEYQNQLQICIPICGDLIIKYFEECDDGNHVPYDGCHQCKFSCPLYCDACQFGQCLECRSSYYLFNNQCIRNQVTFNYEDINIFNNQIGFFEQHQYNNQQQYINSIELDNQLKEIYRFNHDEHKTLKIQYCSQQFYDKCSECDQYYTMSFDKRYCIPKCNDGMTTLKEICDDQNNTQFDGCYKCEESCQLECLICVDTKCQICQQGWDLLNNQCYQICGDNKLAQLSQEQCDDGNFEPSDGCYECKFECDQYCYSCATGDVCYLCQEYFALKNGKCQPICGDGHVIIGLEECEDLNQEQFDGCYQCQFQCHEKCEICDEGKCKLCQQDYITFDGQTCIDQKKIGLEDIENQDELQQQIRINCGDSQKQIDEECDDGNQISNDGCSQQCLIEENWHCIESLPSRCYPYTSIQLQFLNQTYDKIYIQLSFTQKVKWNGSFSNFTEAIQTGIIGFNESQYELTILPVISIEEKIFIYPIYEFEIQLLNSKSEEPILEVYIQEGVIDEHEYILINNIQSMAFKINKILSTSQLEVANKFQQIGTIMMIGLGCSSALMLLFGNPSQSLEIFDTLQFQSYLRFINVKFPQNLQIYFQSSDFVTVQPVLIQLNIIDLFDNLLGQQHIDSFGKLQEYELNADLLTNIYGQVTQASIFVILYIFLLCYQQFFNNYCYTRKHIYYIRLSNSKIIEYIAIKFYLLNMKVLDLVNIFTKKGLIQLFYANSWDLIFKVLMYISSQDHFGYRSMFSYLICLLYLGLIFAIIISHFKQFNKRTILLQDLKIQQHEGIVLFKKLFFLFVLIELQNHSTYQCILLTFILFCYLVLICLAGLICSSLDLLMIVWMEAPVMIFTLLSLVYCSDFNKILNQEQQTTIAFAQIGCLTIGLLGPLIRNGIQFFSKIKQIIVERNLLNQPIQSTFNNMIIIMQK